MQEKSCKIYSKSMKILTWQGKDKKIRGKMKKYFWRKITSNRLLFLLKNHLKKEKGYCK